MTPADVWIRHRKLCKKRASAKWYLKKKQREIQEQNQARQQLEAEYQQRLQRPRFSLLDQCYHRAVLAHRCFGYPVRPDTVSVWLWDYWKDTVEAQLQDLRDTFPGWPWSFPICRALRQLGMRELSQSHAGVWDALQRFRGSLGIHGPSQSVLVGPLGWVWFRLQSVQYTPSDWTRWIQAIQATYPRRVHHSTQSQNPNHTNGHTRMPTHTPNQNAAFPVDSGLCPIDWNRLVNEFEEWMQTQPPSPVSHRSSATDRLSFDSQDSLDSSLLHDIFGFHDDEQHSTQSGGSDDATETDHSFLSDTHSVESQYPVHSGPWSQPPYAVVPAHPPSQ